MTVLHQSQGGVNIARNTGVKFTGIYNNSFILVVSTLIIAATTMNFISLIIEKRNLFFNVTTLQPE